ncbi:hypothetical protein GSI_09100 [Ganoderma sinense ZZ0214-1]|uniref:non-specific serine/threonine protein kinase n=1 Tax=Ganoderma sinense ZZ0214-1 TaxID=1077348 RepID=A0A2G8S5K0_9APHY|nr:hypothetical protein GSI_09100 [Ganoderma sinense ZZ0214-1]
MPGWLSQVLIRATPNSTRPKSKPKGNAKESTTGTTARTTSSSRRPLAPSIPNRPPTPRPDILPRRSAAIPPNRRLPRKPLTILVPSKSKSSSGMRPDTGKAAGSAIYATYVPHREPTSASSRLSFSSVLAEVGVDPEIIRTVRFKEASSHPEPSGCAAPQPAVKSKGSEYVSVTQGARGRERPVPVPLPIYAPTPVPGSCPPPPSLIYAPPSLPSPSPSPAAGLYALRPSLKGSPSGYAAPPTPPRTSSSQSQKHLAGPGPVHVGSFKLLRILEKGAFTKSYAAQDTDSGRIVCARSARKDRMLQDEKIRHGLLVERRAYGLIAAAAPRDQAYLMEVFGVLQDDERVVYLMPLMEGDLIDVSKAVTSYGGLDRSLVRRWVAQLALGIDALHRMGIIHRDLKPENILVDASNLARDPSVRISDFNTAYISYSPLEDGTVCTNDKIGSAPYMAWEVDQGRWYGKMVDWWALGCIAFGMLTNTVLFEGHDDRQEYVWWGHRMDGMSYAAHQGLGKISDPEVDLIDGLVNLHPNSRFQLRHLRYHHFFLDEKKHVNTFDVLLREPAADLLTDASPSSSVEVDGSLKHEPPVHLFFQGDRPPLLAPGREARSRRYCRDEGASVEYAHVPELDDPFAGLDWLNPRGPWRV